MSRFIHWNPDRSNTECIADMLQCRYLIDEVCCNDKSDQCCDFPSPEEYCKNKCPFFTKEDGIIRGGK